MKINNMGSLLVILSCLLFLAASLRAEQARPKDRYFLSGDGWIQLTNAKTGNSARLRYRLPDGSYPPEVRQQINRLFGVSATSDDHISLRLISFLDYFEDRFRQPIEILSGYRSPEYNAKLRAQGRLAATASLHMEGMAADIRVQKSQAAQAFKVIKALQCCGVGYYHAGSLHLDTGPARFWDETSSKVGTGISDRNKRIMVRTDQDIYLPGERVELQLARITDYPIGLAAGFAVVHDGQPLREFSFNDDPEACLAVVDPRDKTATWTIPDGFRPDGKVQLQLHFCEKPFSEMPDHIESNLIVIQ